MSRDQRGAAASKPTETATKATVDAVSNALAAQKIIGPAAAGTTAPPAGTPAGLWVVFA